MILRLVSALSLIAVAASATFAVAQTSPVPDRRIVTEIGQDYYGGDIGSIFDTTFGKCRAACMRNPDCQALTFNSRAGACFLKSELERKTPYDGAISAQMVKTSDAVRALAQTRVKDLDFLPSGFIDEARELAATLGARSATNGRSWEDLRAAAIAADRAGQKDQAARGFGAAVTLSDDPDTWRDLARVWRDMPGEDARARRRLRRDAVSAAINAYLRSEDDAARATALNLLARALEDRGYGREMIPALRLSQALSPRERTEEQLFSAISRFGFRVTEHSVDSDAASPRICVQFSEPLAEAGVDYGPYVRVEGQADLPVEAEGAQLCVEGIVHGERYKLAVREGLPSGAGDTLRRSHEITVYVRDRAPSVRFVGRNYVLPRGADAAIPVVTVNLTEVELQIHRIGDRNLLPIIQDDLFDQALNKWTETRLADRTGAAIWSGTGEVSGPVNADVMTALPIGEAIQDAAPGVYAMTARVPGDTSQWDRAPTQWFIVTDLGLAAMSGADGVHGFVRALSSAAPEEGITVQLIARNNEVLGEAVTDDQGYVRFPPGLARGTGGAAPALLTAAVEGDFAFLDLAKPGFDLSDRGVEGRDAPGPIDVFATTERGVYRPGEVVHTTILARDARAQAIRDLPLTAIITRPDGVEYHRAQIDDQGNGGRSHTMRLGSGVPRGTWKMKIHADPDAAPIRQIAFLVEDFVPEKIDFDLTAPEGPVVPEDGLTVSLNARYLYGAPGADLTVDGSVKVTPTDTIAGFPGFRFGLHDEQVNTALETAPQITTNANGDASLQLAIPNSAAETRPIEMTAIVHVTDSSGRPVERTLTRPLAPAGGRIGIRPLFDGAAEEGGNAGFEIIAVGPDGQIALDRVGWTLSRINRRWQWYELNGRWNYEAVTSRERVANGEIVLTADGRASIEAPVQWGRYELKLQTLEGDYAAASHAFDAGWYSAGGSSDTPDVLEIGLDKPAYRIGDEVRVRLKPRVAGKVLLSVVDNRLIEMTTLDVEPGETETTLTVTEAWGAGAYITATLIRPMDVAAKRNPSRALGLAWATVDPAERALEVEITTPDEVQPRGPMEAAVRIAGLSGETAHVTLAAVDLGILNLTGFAPPAPGDHYFGQRALGIEMRDVYGRLIDGLQGARGRIRSGGDAEAARLKAPPPTEDLVAFHSGVVEVGADGTASVRFALPEFNGTVRIMAVAWSGKGVGHAHKDVLVRDPVVVSAATPRFLAPGDSTRVLLDIAHAKGSAGAVTTRITGDGGISIAEGADQHSIDVQPGRPEQISVPVTAAEIGDPRLTITTTTPDGVDLTKTLTLPVRLNDPEISRQNRIPLPAGGRLVINRDTFAGLTPGTGRASLGVGAIAALDAPGLLTALDRYPYGCTEQLTSRALPLLYFDQVAEAAGLAKKADVDKRIAEAIAKVLENQSNAGSFGLWRPDRGDLWLDAYVTDFLSRARAVGHAVPKPAMASALANLQSAVGYAGDFKNGGEDIAYALMVLAREGMASIGDLRYFADAKAEDLATPMAKAQLGAALASYGEQRRADDMFRLAAGQMTEVPADEETGWRPDYGSYLRDGAAVLALAAEAGSAAVDTADLTRAVAERAANRRWTSTQEKVWMLMATSALVDRQAEGLTIDGQPSDGPLVRIVDDQTIGDGEIVIENVSGAATSAVLTTYGVPTEPEPAGGRGYRIERAYYTLDGVQVSPQQVLQNDRLAVVLTVTPETDRTGRLMVDDPLPAGFEIDNPNLIQAGSVDALSWLDALDEVSNAEFRSDRFLAAVDRGGKGSFRLAYIVRAVSPGSFHHPAAIVEDMYRPELRAWTGTGRVNVIAGAR